MKAFLMALVIALASLTSACAPVGGSVAVRGPNVSVGIHLSSYPRLVRVPGYPVYYAPGERWNYFFYDGLYWAFEGDNWYASSWYNGPWDVIDPFYVPLYVLRVPVRYYSRPPAYFRGWSNDAPPRWDEHWGRDWSTRRSDWNQWDRRSAPPPAPLPTYQREYAGDRYPRTPEQQRSIQSDRYRHEPSDSSTQQYWQRGGAPRPRTEPQPGVRGPQQPRTERTPAPAQQQERTQRPQPEVQERGRQQDGRRDEQGRDDKDKEDKQDNQRRR